MIRTYVSSDRFATAAELSRFLLTELDERGLEVDVVDAEEQDEEGAGPGVLLQIDERVDDGAEIHSAEYLWGYMDALLGELLLREGEVIVTRTLTPEHPEFDLPLDEWE
jgi:hypothetical protein